MAPPKLTPKMNPKVTLGGGGSQSHFGVFPKATLGCFPKPLWGASLSHFGVFPKATSGCFPKQLWDVLAFRMKVPNA